MAFEQPPHHTEEDNGSPSNPMLEKLEKLNNLLYKNIEVHGEENLKEIPPDAKVIFAITHMTDSDVVIATSVLGKYFKNITVADASTHRTFSDNPGAFLGTKIVGEENFSAVSHRKINGKERGILNPDDFDSMKDALDNGKQVIIAAYFKPDVSGRLPDKGGYGAAYLGALTGALIVPVAVNLKKEDVSILNIRPGVDVIIGHPEFLDENDTGSADMNRFAELMRKRKIGEILTKEEKIDFKRLSDNLRDKSDKIMFDLADMLPAHKAGSWANKEE